MRMKRLFAAVLTVAMLAGTLPGAFAATSSFSDLGGMPEVAEAAEFLKLMGVVDGVPGGGYNPAGTLSRAEFCAMAVRALDRADEEPAQRGRTIYLDVGPTFWARGYINLASTIRLGGEDGSPLVAGVGDGTFQPDRAITYGEAVTILCRVLGYSETDVAMGGAWYDGYLALGASGGLTEGLTLSGGDVISRGQAAILFHNLYFAKPKGSDKSYLVSQGGSEVENALILDVNATADDGSAAVKTTGDTYKTDRAFDGSIVGKEGKLLLDSDGKLVAFMAKEGGSSRVVNVSRAEATYLVTANGDRINVEPSTKVYRSGGTTTWESAWVDVSKTGTTVTLHYASNGKLGYIFLGSAAAAGGESMVLRTVPNGASNPFSAMASGNYTMLKNGISATAADLRQWDVATYDAAARLIQVSDLKLTGVYEKAEPSLAAPIRVTVMGHTFDVLASAREDLAAFKIGDRITLLLTVDNQVAGAVSASTVSGNAVGMATVDGTTATVKLLQGGLTVSGDVSSAAQRLNDQLVTVTSSSAGRLSLTAVSGSTVRGSLDVAGRTLGDREVAENVTVYDQVSGGAMVAVRYSDLPATVSSGKIDFAGLDSLGRVRYLVLNDVTGDAYEYGIFSYAAAGREPVYKTEKVQQEIDGIPQFNEDGTPVMVDKPVLDSQGNPVIDHYETTSAPTLCVKQGTKEGGETTSKAANFTGSIRNGAMGGIAYTTNGRVAATVTLESITKVGRSAFDSEEMTVTVAGEVYPISEEVQCYNKSTKSWFAPGKDGMEAARAYSDELTLYYDRTPAEGGKIRMIVVP